MGLILAPFVVNADSKDLNISDPNAMVCEALGKIGIGCGTAQTTPYASHTPTFSPTPNDSGSNSALTATIYNAGTKNSTGTGADIILVRVHEHEEIYEIVGGKKHLIPTMDIFYDYGFKIEWIQDITQKQLNKYPRITLMQVTGDKKKTHYFTEGGMIRLIPDKNVSSSYGDRDEDIIIISKKEFNFYPQNQFVFLENPLNRDVFQLVQGNTKRYVTPQAVKRMKIDSEQIAPINQTELTTYKTGSPIIL